MWQPWSKEPLCFFMCAFRNQVWLKAWPHTPQGIPPGGSLACRWRRRPARPLRRDVILLDVTEQGLLTQGGVAAQAAREGLVRLLHGRARSFLRSNLLLQKAHCPAAAPPPLLPCCAAGSCRCPPACARSGCGQADVLLVGLVQPPSPLGDAAPRPPGSRPWVRVPARCPRMWILEGLPFRRGAVVDNRGHFVGLLARGACACAGTVSSGRGRSCRRYSSCSSGALSPSAGLRWPWAAAAPSSAPPRPPERLHFDGLGGHSSWSRGPAWPEGAISPCSGEKVLPLPHCRGAPAPRAGVSYLRSMALGGEHLEQKDTKALGTRLPRTAAP